MHQKSRTANNKSLQEFVSTGNSTISILIQLPQKLGEAVEVQFVFLPKLHFHVLNLHSQLKIPPSRPGLFASFSFK